MKIAACYIVKDEEENLEQSLKGLVPQVDELIVVDTGSQDDTIQIARQYGASVYSFSWTDDFSTARNYALDRVKADWVIFIDADEYFLEPTEIRPVLLQYDQQEPRIDAIFINRINIDHRKGNCESGRAMMLRIFRADKQIRYRGRIHESIFKADGELTLAFERERLQLYHTGYSADIVQSKVERNLRLLQMDAVGKEDISYQYDYLVDCYFGVKDYAKAKHYAELSLTADIPYLGNRSHIYHMWIESMRQLHDPLEQQYEAACQAIREYPQLPEFYGEAGMILCGMGKLRAARQMLHQALSRYAGQVQQDVPLAATYFTAEIAGRIRQRIAVINQLLSQEKKCMKLSACYITKNEEKVLADSLKSLCGEVDEILVVDTGSTDRTKEIAAAYGARCYDFTWQGDFAAARNEAVAKATGDWIIFLDADESFVASPGQVRQSIERRQDKEALAFQIVNLDVDDSEEKEIDRTFVVRAFRRQPEIRYERRIHEYLLKQGPAMDMGIVPADEVWIRHTGYTPSRSRAKAERNLQLLLAEMETTDKPETLYRYLAEAYDGLGDVQKAIHYAQLDIADGPRAVIYASRCYRLLLLRLTDAEERLAVVRKAVKDFPAMPEFHAEYAEYLAKGLDFPAAVTEMQAALSSYRNHREDGEGMQFNDKLAEMAGSRVALWQQIVQRMAELSISSCIIAKDEAAVIEAWADRAALYSDEILLGDTGSTDATAELARRRQIKVLSIEWQGDFSQARNQLLEKAAGDWIVFLDADEQIRQPEKVRPLLAQIEVTLPEAQGLVGPLINIDTDAYDLEISRFAAVRIWRSKPLRRYCGRIHEAIYDQGSPIAGLVHTEQLQILHTGYSSQRVRQKLERNLRMIQTEIAQTGEKPIHSRYLADCCYGLKEYELAAHYARQAIDQHLPTLEGDQPLYMVWLESLRALHTSWTEQAAVAAQGRKAYPDDLELMAQQGIIFYYMGRAEAAKALLAGMAMQYRRDGERSSAGRIMEGLALLGKLYQEEQKPEAAREIIRLVLRHDPFQVQALDVYAQIVLTDSSAAVFLEQVLSYFPNPDRAVRYLQDWSARQGWLRIYLYCSEKEAAGAEPSTEELYHQIVCDTAEAAGPHILQRAGQDIQSLFRALILLDDGQRCRYPDRIAEWLAALPLPMQRVLKRYYGDEGQLTDPDWEAYIGGWTSLGLRRRATVEQRYAALVLDFDWERVQKLADRLWQEKRWEPLAVLYAQIPLEAIAAIGEFWYRTGVCFYQLRFDNAVVRECFAKAKEAGCLSPDIPAYEQWLQEGDVR